MDELEALKARYDTYLAFTRQLAAKASPTAGLLGLGSSPKDHPGHEEFYEDVGQLVTALLAADPAPAQVSEAAGLLIRSAAEHRDEPLAFWFLFAAQSHARPLIPLLAPEDCAALRTFYDANYPKNTRLPVQKEVYRLLKKGEKGA